MCILHLWFQGNLHTYFYSKRVSKIGPKLQCIGFLLTICISNRKSGLKKIDTVKFFFAYLFHMCIFSIHSSSRHEKRCQMLQRLFWLFQCSKNPRCRDYTTFFSLYKLFIFVLLLVLNGMGSSIGQWLSEQIPIFIPLMAELRQFPTFQKIWTNTFR